MRLSDGLVPVALVLVERLVSQDAAFGLRRVLDHWLAKGCQWMLLEVCRVDCVFAFVNDVVDKFVVTFLAFQLLCLPNLYHIFLLSLASSSCFVFSHTVVFSFLGSLRCFLFLEGRRVLLVIRLVDVVWVVDWHLLSIIQLFGRLFVSILGWIVFVGFVWD